LKFLFKIWSGYDGFRPAEIPNRQLPGGLLRLGWGRYIEAVELGTEVWVYFHGPHAFENGVYVIHEGAGRVKGRSRASGGLRPRVW
jgi:hypothetical protein